MTFNYCRKSHFKTDTAITFSRITFNINIPQLFTPDYNLLGFYDYLLYYTLTVSIYFATGDYILL